MIISLLKITLRDFEEADRAAFVAWQMDPRYRRLYDSSDNPARAGELFDFFLRRQVEEPRHNFQVGILDTATKRLTCNDYRGES